LEWKIKIVVDEEEGIRKVVVSGREERRTFWRPDFWKILKAERRESSCEVFICCFLVHWKMRCS
jgi:hypothetical protein